MVFDNINLKTSSGAVGCTGECNSARGVPNGYPEVSLRLIDTVGLYESLEGTVPSEKALEMLEKKFNSLYATEGIHLILFCIRKGRQSNATSELYQAIVHDFCENQVPCILVITRCEDDDPLGEWWSANQDALRNRLKFDVRDAVAVTTLKDEENLNEYNESRKHLIKAIQEYALKEPWRTTHFLSKITSRFKRPKSLTSNSRITKSDPMNDYLQRPMNTSAKSGKSVWSKIFGK